MNAEEFQLHVVDKLASLSTQMQNLVGNGQPGRIGKLEAEVKGQGQAIGELNKARWTIGGIATGLSLVGGELLHYLFHSK
jgi:hypothetical protein